MDNTIYCLKSDPFKCCCVCFYDHSFIYNNQYNVILGISDIEREWFDDHQFNDELLVSCPCNNHYICIGCHVHIEKILQTTEEQQNFREHAEQYAFPGMTRIKCPCPYYGSSMLEIKTCNTDILVENTELKNKPIGELILECTQNFACRT